MGKSVQTKTKTPAAKKTKAPKRAKKHKSRTSDIYTPEKIRAIVSSNELLHDQSIPFHSIVGHLDLDPYVWITLAEDKGTDKEFTLTPLRSGLKNISLSNETQKYPKVDFTLYVHDYRGIENNAGRAITEFHIGANFYVKWGYASNHTQWGPFRVMERDISFEEGTALLQVTGVMGARLLATSTAEVFSNSSKGTIIDQIASLVDIPVSKTNLLQEEVKKISASDQHLTTSGQNLGKGLYKVVAQSDIEMHFDPESNVLNLSTPFKYELVKRGKKPIKMTYGYPTSNIAKLDVETKHPIKKGVSANFVLTNGQKPNSNFVQTDETVRYAVQGRIPYIDKDNTEKDWVIGTTRGRSWGVWVFPTKETKDDGITVKKGATNKGYKQAIRNAQKKWPPEEGYRVSATQGGESYDARNMDSWALLIEKEVYLTNNTVYEDKFVTRSEYASAIVDTSKKVTVLLNTDPNDSGLIHIRQYSILPQQKPTPQPSSTSVNKPKTTTVETEVSPAKLEGEETTDMVVSIASIRTDLLNYTGSFSQLKDKYKNQLTEYREKVQGYREDENKISKVKESTVGGITFAKWVTVRADPSAASKSKQSGASADTANVDSTTPQPGFEPKSQTTGVGTPSRRIKLTKVTIDLKAGDWTMRVGTIIQIVDIHKKINGFYYVFAEEHSIDTNGFHTTIKCKKASKKMVNQYGSKALRSSPNPNPTNTTRRKVVIQEYDQQVVDKAVRQGEEALKEGQDAVIQKRRELMEATNSTALLRNEAL